MKKVLFVRPAHDDVVSYLYFYSKQLLQDSNSKGFITLNKEKEDASQVIVTSVITKNNPRFIMFNGHGNTSTICGHADKVLIRAGYNHNLLNTRIVYAFSCSSAEKLGKAVADKNSTFIGYAEDFALGMDANSQAAIHRDKRAKLFLEPSNLLVKSLLKGNTANEAVIKAKEMMKQNIMQLRTDPFPDAKDYIPYLYNNYLVLEVLGAKNAKI